MPLIPAYAKQPCSTVTYQNGTTITYPSGTNCAVNTPQNNLPQQVPTTQTTSVTSSIGTIPNGILNQFQSFISNIVSNSGLTPDNNPIHLDSGKLNTVSSSWLDTVKKILGVGYSLHNSTATTIANTSPVPIDPMLVFIIGAIFTIILMVVILWKFIKGLMKVVGVILVIIIILMEYKIQMP
ncbi:MAG: hypothetical protein KGI08_10695 [Thaumarchaeota archaeon]|nr:hypothetical protein [Nitrososphaerota archaeon]